MRKLTQSLQSKSSITMKKKILPFILLTSQLFIALAFLFFNRTLVSKSFQSSESSALFGLILVHEAFLNYFLSGLFLISCFFHLLGFFLPQKNWPLFLSCVVWILAVGLTFFLNPFDKTIYLIFFIVLSLITVSLFLIVLSNKKMFKKISI